MKGGALSEGRRWEGLGVGWIEKGGDEILGCGGGEVEGGGSGHVDV